MSALEELTPVDTPIFDDNVIEEMERHSHDTPVCFIDPRPATASLTCTACRLSRLVCAQHEALILSRMKNTRVIVRCNACGAKGPWPVMARVVPL